MRIYNTEEIVNKGIVSNGDIINADCLDVMKFIPDKSVDMVLCDLPYSTTLAAWDLPVDLEKLWEEYKRIIKPNGVIALFAASPFDKILGCSNLKWLKYEWIWVKSQGTGFLNAKKSPLKHHEQILIFYKKQPKYYPQMTTGHTPVHSYTKRPEIQNKTELYGKMNKTISGGGETTRYPKDVLFFPSDKQKNKLDGTIFSTQKPLELCKYLIKTYTDEGDVVLDNCAGSFTSIIAAISLNRNYIGIEKEKKCFDILEKRLLKI